MAMVKIAVHQFQVEDGSLVGRYVGNDRFLDRQVRILHLQRRFVQFLLCTVLILRIFGRLIRAGCRTAACFEDEAAILFDLLDLVRILFVVIVFDVLQHTVPFTGKIGIYRL